MKIVIDEKSCKKHKMTDQEILIALAVRAGKYEEVVQNMLNREILVKDKGQLKITQRWSDVADEIIADSSNEISEERLEALANKLKECFPQGRTPDKKYIYRCNKKEIMQSLKKFFNQFGNYTDDEVIDAAKRYVASFRGNYAFMRIVKYFIIKDLRRDGGDIISDLATFLENKESEEDVVNTNSDEWLTNIRN